MGRCLSFLKSSDSKIWLTTWKERGHRAEICHMCLQQLLSCRSDKNKNNSNKTKGGGGRVYFGSWLRGHGSSWKGRWRGHVEGVRTKRNQSMVFGATFLFDVGHSTYTVHCHSPSVYGFLPQLNLSRNALRDTRRGVSPS